MKVLLKQDFPNLGKAGEVKDVADGYARNYLIPRGIAVPATRGILKQAELERQVRAQRQASIEQETQDLAEALKGVVLTFQVRAGENEQLYGSITNADIAEALERRLGRTVDRRKIDLQKPIRRLGSYRIPIRLGRGLVPHIGVVVQRQEE